MTQFLQEILQQPEAITNTAAYYDTMAGESALRQFTDALSSARKVVATGMGSSYFLANAMQVFLAKHGIAVTVINAGELLHYELNVVDNDTLLVAISQSGESYETVNVVNKLDEAGVRPRVAVITNEPSSTLGRRADVLLQTVAGVEKKTSTKTFITGFQVLYMIERCLAGETVGADVWSSLSGCIAETLNQRNNVLPGMLRALGDASYLQLIARGTVMASASQSALMAMEASHTPSQALAGGEFRHGPLEMVGQGFTAVVLAPTTSGTWAQTARLVDDIINFGGRVLLVTDRDDVLESREGLTVVAAPTPHPELFAITSIIPVQVAIEAWAREYRGIEPGIFTHGAKVTARE
ncbi:MAG: SIS domain-containing protein [Bacteroides sp.]|nr:SIS domain-containing protein [Bacteroides sp.]